MNNSKILTKGLTLFLAILMAAGAPLKVYAASINYVSDVVCYTASSFDEAKKGLEALGYQIVDDSNLNSTLETGVYLGYKTTTNKEEAITDIAAMNMNGPYSYTDYEDILEGQREEIMAKLDELIPAIAAFQESFRAGEVSGKLCFAALNQYIEDDSNKTMGDVFLSYDFSDEMKKELTEVLLQGSSTVVLSMFSILALTAGNGVLDKMSEYGLEGVFAQYLKNNKNNSTKAMNAMNADLAKRVIAIQNDWDNLYSILCDVEEKYIKIDGEEIEIILPTVEDLSDCADTEAIMEEVNLYLSLKACVIDKTSGMTALEYFKRPFESSNLTDLYLFAYCLSDAQAGLLTYLSLEKILAMDSYILDDGSKEAEEILQSFEKDAKTFVSVYDGIDRTYFESGVAFTSEATKHESLSGESWSSCISSSAWIASIIATSTLSLACLGAGIGVMKYTHNIRNAAFGQEKAIVMDAFNEAINTRANIVKELEIARVDYEARMAEYNVYLLERESPDIKFVMELNESEYLYRDLERELELADRDYFSKRDDFIEFKNRYNQSISKGFKIFTCVMFALAIVFFILDVFSIVMYFLSETKEEESIPVHLVTALSDGDGKTDYVYYNTVNDQAGNPADLNNHEGDKSVGWLVLYYTKDPLAGDPITADALKVQTGSTKISENSYGIHMFNETSPANLTAEKYTSVSDSVGGTYVIFERAESLAVGSVITNGQAIIYMLAGLAIGSLVTYTLTKTSKKKRQAA